MKKILLLILLLCSSYLQCEEQVTPSITPNTEHVIIVRNAETPNYEKAIRGVLITTIGGMMSTSCVFGTLDIISRFLLDDSLSIRQHHERTIKSIFSIGLTYLTWQVTKYGMRTFDEGMRGK